MRMSLRKRMKFSSKARFLGSAELMKGRLHEIAQQALQVSRPQAYII